MEVKAVIFDMFETLITQYNSPLYFREQMAADASLSVEDFQKIWQQSENDRTLGKTTLENVVRDILTQNGKYSEKLLNKIVSKRTETKRDLFCHMHEEIIPMMEELRRRGLKIGLISNCYSEEAMVIRDSCLAKYFDAMCLSYEQGVKKPDREIFLRCVEMLEVKCEECIYVGDGGNNELEAAREVGMTALQAGWYLKDLSKMKVAFVNLNSPMEVMRHIYSN